MNASRFPLGLRALTFAALLTALTGSAHASRFIVPTDNSSSSSSNNPPPPPPPPSSSSSSSSHTPPPPPPSNNHNNSDRFIVPTPANNNDSPSRHGGGYGGGYGSGYGRHHSYDPFWGGCYYWGGNYYYWGGHYYDPFHQRFGRYRDPFEPEYRRSAPPQPGNQAPIFFPPSPPPLGAPIPPRQPASASITAPDALRTYVYEPFYAPLSTRLARADLTRKNLQRLETYRATRGRLQQELIQRLDRLKDAAPATRADELATLALAQDGELRKLEAEADALRGDLLHGGLVGLFSGTGDWNENRQWRLGAIDDDQAREKTLAYEFRVVRAAAFYQDGLSLPQRRLLREVEMELQIEAFKPKTASTASPGERLLFFSPETARLPLPADLPVALSLKIETYEKEKAALKSELRDAIYSLDSAPAPKRASALRRLAETQSPAIATLEALAEEIRGEFARLPNPPGPPVQPAFPPALAARITAYQTEKTALQKNLQAGLEDVRKTKGAFTITPAGKPDTARVEAPKSDHSAAIISAARNSVETFSKENQERLAALTKEREAIRTEIARFASEKDAGGGKSVETLLNDFTTHLQQGERWQYYRYYQIALLEPGLSPEQRRLLFEVALEHLNLPLPAGEYPP